MSTSPNPPPAFRQSLEPRPLPTWMRRLGAGLTATVAVLFLVLLQQVRQQASRIEALRGRVQALENARDLERTNALEEQLRTTVRRLRALDGLADRVEDLRSQQDSLRQQLRQRPSTPAAPAMPPLPRDDLEGGLTPPLPAPGTPRPSAPPQP